MSSDKKTIFSGKYVLKTTPKGNQLISSPTFSLTRICCPLCKFILSQSGNKTSLNGNAALYNRKNILLTIFGKSSLQNDETTQNFPISSILRCHFGNKAALSVGVDDFDYFVAPLPQTYTVSLMSGKNLENGMNVFGGLYSAYSTVQKGLSSLKFALGFKNSKFSSLFNLNFIKNNEVEEEDSEKKFFDCKKYSKVFSIKADNKVNSNLTVGGDAEMEVEKKELKTRFFANYQLDAKTLIKGRWEDKDKSLLVTVNHFLFGMMRMSFSGKFIPVKDKESRLPAYKTKFGVSLEVNDTLV